MYVCVYVDFPISRSVYIRLHSSHTYVLYSRPASDLCYYEFNFNPFSLCVCFVVALLHLKRADYVSLRLLLSLTDLSWIYTYLCTFTSSKFDYTPALVDLSTLCEFGDYG